MTAAITSRLEALADWGVDLDLIRLNASWTPAHRLEIMEGIIQVGLQSRQQTLDADRYAPLLHLHFTSPKPLLASLQSLRVIYIGRLAGVIQGVPSVSYTLDLCYAQDEETRAGIVQSLAPFAPNPAITAEDLAVNSDCVIIDTSLLVVRLFPAVPGIGAFETSVCHTTTLDIDGIAVRALRLDALLTSLAVAAEPDDAFFVPLVEATDLLQRVF
jgi:hypothetical protein